MIAEGRAREMHQIALYLWLAAITGARRGELCTVQVCDRLCEGCPVKVVARRFGLYYPKNCAGCEAEVNRRWASLLSGL